MKNDVVIFMIEYLYNKQLEELKKIIKWYFRRICNIKKKMKSLLSINSFKYANKILDEYNFEIMHIGPIVKIQYKLSPKIYYKFIKKDENRYLMKFHNYYGQAYCKILTKRQMEKKVTAIINHMGTLNKKFRWYAERE